MSGPVFASRGGVPASRTLGPEGRRPGGIERMKCGAQGNLAVVFARAKSEGGERGWGPREH